MRILSGINAITVNASGVVTSTVASGTPPLTVTSPTKIPNVNVDMVDDLHAAAAATPSTIIARDANGRAKVADPSATDDIATKGYVDALFVPLVFKVQEYVATEGQTAFTLTNGSYTMGSNTIDVFISGVTQPPSSYTETSGTIITLSSGVAAGTRVWFKWIEAQPVPGSYLQMQNYVLAMATALG